MRGWRPAIALVLVLGGQQPSAAQQSGAGGRGNGAGGPPSSGPGPGGVAGRPAGLGDAPGPAPSAGPTDAEAVRQAVASGRSVPYSQVLSAVAAVVQGTVVDVEILRTAADGLAYRVKVLTLAGALRQVVVDARQGTVQSVR